MVDNSAKILVSSREISRLRVTNMTTDGKPARTWQQIAAELRREQDSEKCLLLAEELDEALRLNEARRNESGEASDPHSQADSGSKTIHRRSA